MTYKFILTQCFFLVKIPVNFILLAESFVYKDIWYLSRYSNSIHTYSLRYVAVNNVCLFLIYVLVFFFVFSTIRATLPRIRIDLLLDLIWNYFILYSFFIILLLLLYQLCLIYPKLSVIS